MFGLLQLDNTKFRIVILEWSPIQKNEPIELYAQRMAHQIPENNQPSVIVGVSFGGLIAIEVSKLRPGARTIIISSIKTINELPGYLRFLGKLNLHHYLPLHWVKKLPWFFAWVFGAGTDIEKQLLSGIIRDTNMDFVKWAFTAIVNWRNKQRVVNLIHVHSNQDKIFPLSYIMEPDVVYSGGHLIIFSAAAELSVFINRIADQLFYAE